jgi:hypothetical protein
VSGAVERVLAEQIAVGGGRKPFAEMTLAEVRGRAEELSEAAAVGAMAQRVAPVASAWRGLAEQMERTGAASVAELDPDEVASRAERLWIVPPGGSLLGGS